MEVARANDDAFPGLGSGKRAARLDRDDVRVPRQEPVLGGEARAVQARFLGPREERVDVVRRSFVPKRQEHRDDQRASGDVVGGAHADLVPRDLGRREVEHRELTDGEGRLRADPAHRGGVVQRFHVGDRLAQDRRERGRARVVVDRHRNIGREHTLAKSAQHPGLSGLARRFDDLESWVIGVRREDKRALRRARRNARVDLPERVGPRRNTAPLELATDRVQHRPFVVWSGWRQRDALQQ